MTHAVTIGADTVTNDIVSIIVEGEQGNGANTCELILLNESNEWDNDFTIKEAINIDVDGDNLFDGYVEDVTPYQHPDYQDLQMIKVVGLDYGFDLVKLFIIKEYPTDTISKLDDVIDDALDEASAEVTYTSGSAGPVVVYSYKRTYLNQSLRELCEENDYSYYVDSSKALHLFPLGDASEYLDGDGGRADVDLESIALSRSNNILEFKEGESQGSKLFNYVEITAGNVRDHWTEMSAGVYTPGANVTITDNTGTFGTDFVAGKASVKMTVTAETDIEGTLDFTSGLYEYMGLDLTERNIGYYVFYCGFDAAVGYEEILRLRLEDDAGNVIEFKRGTNVQNPASRNNRTDGLTNGEWYKVEFPYGKGTTISSTVTDEGWVYMPPAAAFNWADVKKIIFDSFYSAQSGGYVLLDDLYLPTVECKSIAQDETSITAYGKRMYYKNRSDIKSQVELNTLVDSLLARHKAPPQYIECLCIGNTDIKYTGQSLDVNAPPYGIDVATKYRIQKLSHKVTLKGAGPSREYIYTTELTLLKDQVDGSTQKTSQSHFRDALMNSITSMSDYWSWYDAYEQWRQGTGPYPTYLWSVAEAIPSGTSFPASPKHAEMFILTTAGGGYDAGLYMYDVDEADWVLISLLYHDQLEGLLDDDHTQYLNTARHDAWPHDSDVMQIELRPWVSNIGFVWDEGNLDYDEIWWGQGGDEKNTDAAITFADGTTTGVNKGTEAAIADGVHYFYWDETQKTLTKYDLQHTTTYSTAVGTGKGLVAVVHISEADSEAPTFLTFNSYTPTIGGGVIGAYSIMSKHFSADWITGKNFRTAATVGEAGGPAGVRFSSAGITGYSGGTTKTFDVDASTGDVIVYGDGSFQIKASNGTALGEVGADDIGQAYFEVKAAAGKDVYVKAGDNEVLISASTGGVAIKGASWITLYTNTGGGEVNISNGDYLSFDGGGLDPGRLCLPVRDADPAAPMDGEIWIYNP